MPDPTRQRKNGLTPLQERGVVALLQCKTLGEAADQVGVNPRTMRRWQGEPLFKERFREARKQIVDHAMVELQGAAAEAVATLKRNLTCGSGYVEVAAAKTILEHAIGAVELDSLIARVEQLESYTKGDDQ